MYEVQDTGTHIQTLRETQRHEDVDEDEGEGGMDVKTRIRPVPSF